MKYSFYPFIKLMKDLLTKLKKILFFTETDPAHLLSIRKQIREDNRRFVIIWALVQNFYWFFCFFMSFRDISYNRCRNAYIAAILLCFTALVIAAFLAPKKPSLVYPAIFLIKLALLGAGVWIAQIQLYYNTRTVVLFASVLIVPIMFISDTLFNILILLLNILAFMFVNATVLDPAIYSWTLTNLIIFSTVGTMIGHFVNQARFERYVFAESAVQLAELQTRYAYYDQLTGLRNRRGYDEKINELSVKLPENCYVVMADINGLKEANDNLGHDAGDELIVASADALTKAFGDEAFIYRLGGDEFGVITFSDKEDMEKRMQKLQEITAAYDGKEIHGVSISAGLAGADEFQDIDTILKTADERMYKQKAEYYRISGKDRRK